MGYDGGVVAAVVIVVIVVILWKNRFYEFPFSKVSCGAEVCALHRGNDTSRYARK